FSYENMLALASLWKNFIPSMNVYNTFDMPMFYYFISHLPVPEGAVVRSSYDPIPLRRAWWTYSPLDASSRKLLQGLGVRYVLQAQAEGDETRSTQDDAVLRRRFGPATVGERQIVHSVYEYGDPNVGNYSPTNVMTARDAPSILHYLWMSSFDPRQSI